MLHQFQLSHITTMSKVTECQTSPEYLIISNVHHNTHSCQVVSMSNL